MDNTTDAAVAGGADTFSLLVLIIVIATSIWVYADAKSLGLRKGQLRGVCNMGPVGWFFACLGLWIISFPMYLARRQEIRRINRKAPSYVVPPAVPAPPNLAPDFEQQLMKLARLKDSGVLTEEEFVAKKRAILGLDQSFSKTGPPQDVQAERAPKVSPPSGTATRTSKRCTWCGKEYPDDATVCAIDGRPLVPVATPQASRAPRVVGITMLFVVAGLVLWSRSLYDWMHNLPGSVQTSQQNAAPNLISKVEWRQKLSPYWRPGGPWRVMTIADFKSMFGEPSHTQTFEGHAYWDYDCSDGTIQLELVDPAMSGSRMLINSVNDY